MVVGQSKARTDMALRLLYLEPRAERGRRRNKEAVIMDWTSLLMIETVFGFLGIFALYFLWKDQNWLLHHMLEKGRESMLTETFSQLRVVIGPLEKTLAP